MFQPGRVVPVCAVKMPAVSSGLGLMTAILLTQQSFTNATSKVQRQVQPQLLVWFQERLDAPLVSRDRPIYLFAHLHKMLYIYF